MLLRVVSPALASLLILTTRQCLPCGYTRGYTQTTSATPPACPGPAATTRPLHTHNPV